MLACEMSTTERVQVYIINKLQSKMTRYYYIPIKMAKSRTLTAPGTGKDTEQQNSHVSLVGKMLLEAESQPGSGLGVQSWNFGILAL